MIKGQLFFDFGHGSTQSSLFGDHFDAQVSQVHQ